MNIQNSDSFMKFLGILRLTSFRELQIAKIIRNNVILFS